MRLYNNFSLTGPTKSDWAIADGPQVGPTPLKRRRMTRTLKNPT
jgi:hypothetical protein